MQPLLWLFNQTQITIQAQKWGTSQVSVTYCNITAFYGTSSPLLPSSTLLFSLSVNIKRGWWHNKFQWIPFILIQFALQVPPALRNIWPLWMADLHNHNLPSSSSRSFGIDLLTHWSFASLQCRFTCAHLRVCVVH